MIWLPFGTGVCLGSGVATLPVHGPLGLGLLTLGVVGTQILLWKRWI